MGMGLRSDYLLLKGQRRKGHPPLAQFVGKCYSDHPSEFILSTRCKKENLINLDLLHAVSRHFHQLTKRKGYRAHGFRAETGVFDEMVSMIFKSYCTCEVGSHRLEGALTCSGYAHHLVHTLTGFTVNPPIMYKQEINSLPGSQDSYRVEKNVLIFVLSLTLLSRHKATYHR